MHWQMRGWLAVRLRRILGRETENGWVMRFGEKEIWTVARTLEG